MWSILKFVFLSLVCLTFVFQGELMAKALKVGDKAPDFKLLNQDKEEISLKKYDKQWVVLYFYPKDSTPGCTIEGIEFSGELKNYEKLNATVVGVSADTVESHCKFIAKQKLKVELLSDPDKGMIKAYNVWKLKKFMGREFMGIVRSTFLIDPKGKIAFIWPEVSAKGHAKEVLEKLKELQ
jgi:peroxiredoxin Q/BCP